MIYSKSFVFFDTSTISLHLLIRISISLLSAYILLVIWTLKFKNLNGNSTFYHDIKLFSSYCPDLQIPKVNLVLLSLSMWNSEPIHYIRVHPSSILNVWNGKNFVCLERTDLKPTKKIWISARHIACLVWCYICTCVVKCCHAAQIGKWVIAC